ncbi:MAG: hypothetical protein QM760_08785 [Nibricoccus sp.]
MKTKSVPALKNFWLMLTEVPGWPDAPVWARTKRAMPVLLPCAGMLFFAVWYFAIHAPHVRAEKEAALPLVALEDEIALLQLATSEQQVAELNERAGAASRLLLDSPADVTVFLKGLKKEAASRGFEATFVSSDVSGDPGQEGLEVTYVPVRGKLTPGPGNTEPFVNLLALLDRFASSGKRIDLMRLAVRADEQKWQTVELNFRLVCPVVHEKTP